MDEKTTHSKRSVPLFLFQHPWFSMSEKILLVYSTMADSEGRCSLSSRTTLILIGEEITDNSLIALRKARAKLEAEGHIRHDPILMKDKTIKHTWIVTAYATSSDAVDTWQSFQPDRQIVDRGFGSGTGTPVSTKTTPEVDDWLSNLEEVADDAHVA